MYLKKPTVVVHVVYILIIAQPTQKTNQVVHVVYILIIAHHRWSVNGVSLRMYLVTSIEQQVRHVACIPYMVCIQYKASVPYKACTHIRHLYHIRCIPYKASIPYKLDMEINLRVGIILRIKIPPMISYLSCDPVILLMHIFGYQDYCNIWFSPLVQLRESHTKYYISLQIIKTSYGINRRCQTCKT